MFSLRLICSTGRPLAYSSDFVLPPWLYLISVEYSAHLTVVSLVLLCLGFHRLSSSPLRFRLFHRFRFLSSYLRSCWIPLQGFVVIFEVSAFVCLLGLHFIAFLVFIVVVCRWLFQLLH